MMTSTLSKQIVCIVDACYSGAAKLGGSKSSGKDTSAVASATYDKVWKRVPKAEGKYLLLSSQSYERSWSTETNSIYTRYLIEGLKGIPFEFDGNGESIPYSGSIDPNGNVTPELLHDYVYYKIASQKFEGEIQIPKIKVDKSSKIILARYPKAVKRTDEIVAEQVHKRKYHAFLSRAHVNRTIADNLHTWLRNAVRDSEGTDHIYYHKPEPGVEKSSILRDLIPQCRSIIMLLSSDSLGEGWIKDEDCTAKNHKDLFSDFKIIPVRIEECKVPEDLKKDLGDSLIELSNGKLDLDTSKEILERMYYRQRTGPGPEQGHDLYISRGWRQEEKSLAENICRLLDKEGFRLIGDAEDQKEYDVSRVKSIISSCGGFVAIVPYRAKEKKLTTSK